MPRANKADQILEVAQDLLMRGGFNNFSFRDLADAVGVKTAAVHYHFPTKTDLGLAVLHKTMAGFAAATEEWAALPTGREKIKAVIAQYRAHLDHARLCPFGVIAAEVGGVPIEMTHATGEFFDLACRWTAKVVQESRDAGEVVGAGDADHIAKTIQGALYGGLIMARSTENHEDYDQIAATLLNTYFPVGH